MSVEVRVTCQCLLHYLLYLRRLRESERHRAYDPFLSTAKPDHRVFRGKHSQDNSAGAVHKARLRVERFCQDNLRTRRKIFDSMGQHQPLVCPAMTSGLWLVVEERLGAPRPPTKGEQ